MHKFHLNNPSELLWWGHLIGNLQTFESIIQTTFESYIVSIPRMAPEVVTRKQYGPKGSYHSYFNINVLKQI